MTGVMAVGLMDGLLACSLCFGLMRSQLGTHETLCFLEALLQAAVLSGMLMLDARKALDVYSTVNDDRWLLFTRNVDRGGTRTSRIKW